MEDRVKIKNKIDEEVERRLKEKLSEIESRIRQEVKEEFEKKPDSGKSNGKSAAAENKIEEPKKDSAIPVRLESKISEPVEDKKPDEEYFVRFGANFRFQHIVLLTSTVMLILTGVPLKFPQSSVAQFIISWFGGAPGARSLHHFFALGLIFIGIYHLVYSFWAKSGRRDFFELLPSLKDFSDVFNQIKYYLGIKKEKVKYGRFSYVEKFDYWAVYWGLIMMIGTGAIMWLFQGKFEPVFLGEINLSFGSEIITNYVHAIAREMHSDEALLATLVIIGWHFYNVHLNPHKFPMSKVWLNGKMTKKEMLDEHPLELKKILKEKEEAEAEKQEAEKQEAEKE
jgi:cytochrome b subunit of formate dehydrogenase